MTSDVLLAHFDRISEADDAIPRLRAFILDLAVRGKLVAQNANDESAATLVKRLRNGARANSGYRKLESLPPIKNGEIPFALPRGWEWERIGNIGETNIGLTYSPQDISDVGIPVLRANNIQDGKLNLNDLVRVQVEPKPSVMVQEGDLLICARNGSRALVGKAAVIENLKEPTAFGAFMAVFRSEVNQYVYQFICSPLFRKLIAEVNTTTINQITQRNLRSTLLPLPPLAEQNRIIAKVGEVMAICDRLEVAQEEREGRRHRLVSASLRGLTASTNGEYRQERAKFFVSHLAELTSRPQHIPEFRQAILDLAVRGRLVPQDQSEEPASELLKRIQTEKSRRINERSLRKEKPFPPILKDEIPFAIPASWCWTRIGVCSLLTEYGTSVKSDQAEHGVPILAMGNIQGGRIILDNRKKVSCQIKDLPQLFLKRFDLLYNRTNSPELVGKTGIYLGEDDAYTFASYLIRIRFLNDLTSPAYVNFAMNAPYFRPTQIVPELRQQCGQANVNGSKLRNMIVPLPPFAEQLRIVSKIDDLMNVCDRLEKQLRTLQSDGRDLLEAVLNQVLSAHRGKGERLEALYG